MMNATHKLTPAVSPRWLILLAGLVWVGVGSMLSLRALHWSGSDILVVSGGIILGLIKARFGFQKVVSKNLARLNGASGDRCLFGFIPWKSYLLIAAMMGLGWLLRHSPVPLSIISLIYLGVGTAMLASSFGYFHSAFSRK